MPGMSQARWAKSLRPMVTGSTEGPMGGLFMPADRCRSLNRQTCFASCELRLHAWVSGYTLHVNQACTYRAQLAKSTSRSNKERAGEYNEKQRMVIYCHWFFVGGRYAIRPCQ